MNLQLLAGLLFAISPVMELRGAIPLLIHYSLENNTPWFGLVSAAIVLNIFTIIIVYSFLELIHHSLLKHYWYEKAWNHGVHNRLRKHVERIEKKHKLKQYFLLLFFIALPLPGTGVWSSTTIAWLLGLNKKKSFITLSIGATIAGMIITIITLRILGIFY